MRISDKICCRDTTQWDPGMAMEAIWRISNHDNNPLVTGLNPSAARAVNHEQTFVSGTGRSKTNNLYHAKSKIAINAPN